MEDIDGDYIEGEPLRTDAVYTEIENIPAYCRTQSIAFYMAIRNKDAIRLLDRINIILSEDIRDVAKIDDVLMILESIENILNKVVQEIPGVKDVLKYIKKVNDILSEIVRVALTPLGKLNILCGDTQDIQKFNESFFIFKKVKIILNDCFNVNTVSNEDKKVIKFALILLEKTNSLLTMCAQDVVVNKDTVKLLKNLNDVYGLNKECITTYSDMEACKFMPKVEISKIDGTLKDLISSYYYHDEKLIMTDGENSIKVDCPMEVFLSKIRKYYKEKNKYKYDSASKIEYIETKNAEIHELDKDNNILILVIDNELKIEIVKTCSKTLENLPHLKLYYPVPELTVPTMNKVSIQVNLTYPEEELVELIKEYKRMSSEDDSIVQSFMNTLAEGEDETKLPIDNERVRKIKKTKAELLADNFFIYDYILWHMNNNELLNNEATDYYEKNIEIIHKRRKRREIEYSEKHRALKAEKEIYDESYYNSKIIEYFQDKKLQKRVNKKEDSLRKIYYMMDKFIAKKQYIQLMK